MTSKYDEERKFWADEISRYVKWYRGEIRSKEMYGVRCPDSKTQIRRFETEQLNAIETWINCDKWRYCRHLIIEPTYFSGKIILEVGCGPLGLSRFFAGAKVTGIDPLHTHYSECGYPIHMNSIINEDLRIEDFNAPDESFDAVISVNAIDHVDDFKAAIAQCERVCRSDGEIRIEVHYHAATVTEPHVLTDSDVGAAFSKFAVRKISENPSWVFYPKGTHPESDRFALWSNRDHIYRGAY